MLEKEESQTLDAIRGMAALVVLLMHAKQWFICPLIGWDHPSVVFTSHLTHFAVLVFFALSGFVITHSLRVNARRNNGRIDAAAYLRSRLSRILPPAIAATLFAVAVAILILGLDMHGADSFRTEHDKWVERESVSIRAKDVVATALLSNGVLAGTKAIGVNPPMWSLSLEFWAYFIALFAACAITGLRSRNVGQRSDGWTHLFAFGLLMLPFAARPLDVFQYFFYWTIGALLFARRIWPRPVGWLLGALVVLGGVSLVRCMKLSEDWNLLFENGAAGIWGIPIKGALLVLSALLVPLARRMPTRQLFVRLSRSSYTLYLFHYPLLCLAFSIFHLDYLEWSSVSRGVFLLGLTFGILGGCHWLAGVLEDKRGWSTWFERLIVKVRG